MRSGEVGTIYNIGGGNERTNREVTDMILSEMGRGEESVEYVEDRLGHDRRYSIASERIATLGWTPAVDFERAVSATVAWYLDNESWWRPLQSRVKNR